MEVYVARQPILTRKQEIFAYELLYRSNKHDNLYSNGDFDQATSEVINSLLQIGIEEITEGKPCFINFTETLLENTFPTFLQPELMVIEVLETVRPTERIIENCRILKAQGYKIALDDFELRDNDPYYWKLIELADIVKIDVQKSSRLEQLKIMKALNKYNMIFLAEKVETREEYEQCLKDGYTFFQGYFFSKPVILRTSDLPILNHNLFVIISELSKEEPDIDKLTTFIESDVSLSYKLLRLLNSPAIGLVYKIKSIKQAIVLLGLIELRKWVYVLSFREHLNKTDFIMEEVIKLSLTRAKASELINISIGKRSQSSSAFIAGLFSLVETIFKQPLGQILNKLPLDQEIKQTLLGEETSLTPVKDLVFAAEKGEWSEIDRIVLEVGLNGDKFSDLYKQSIKWAKDVLVGTEALN
ncbi:EAL and HDOD domain-containing protein [Ornithinibacillus californiensis]|uniref:EAL and HDOD domain-containing protein n=1 Tax=Ornithinibacillus californiensis TaxID=161536 RepID=UPI00064DAE01|nr:HDOD domain-containing protein [Ornithinibacillus californiensis]